MLNIFTNGISEVCAPFNINDFGQIQEYNLLTPVFVCGKASSSLDVARYFINKNNFPVWASIVCLEQEKGRGQLGRAWFSPRGNLFVALRLPYEPPFAGIEAATVLSAMLCEVFALQAYDIKMKFPNDLVRNIGGVYHKVGGILLEERENILLAGIGLNLVAAPALSLMRENYALPPAKFFDVQDLTALNLWQNTVSNLVLYYQDKICHLKTGWQSLAKKYLIDNRELDFNKD